MKNQNFVIRQTDHTTSIYKGPIEICKFVTGNRKLNTGYANLFLISLEISDTI